MKKDLLAVLLYAILAISGLILGLYLENGIGLFMAGIWCLAMLPTRIYKLALRLRGSNRE